MSLYSLTRLINLIALAMLIPFFSDRMSAFWIVGPSAIGSEKGIPSSSMSAPASIAVLTISKLVSISGSPITKNGISAALSVSPKTSLYVFIYVILISQVCVVQLLIRLCRLCRKDSPQPLSQGQSYPSNLSDTPKHVSFPKLVLFLPSLLVSQKHPALLYLQQRHIQLFSDLLANSVQARQKGNPVLRLQIQYHAPVHLRPAKDKPSSRAEYQSCPLPM